MSGDHTQLLGVECAWGAHQGHFSYSLKVGFSHGLQVVLLMDPHAALCIAPHGVFHMVFHVVLHKFLYMFLHLVLHILLYISSHGSSKMPLSTASYGNIVICIHFMIMGGVAPGLSLQKHVS